MAAATRIQSQPVPWQRSQRMARCTSPSRCLRSSTFRQAKRPCCGFPTWTLPNIRRWRRSESRRSEEHTSELQSRLHLVCRLLLEKKKIKTHHLSATYGPNSLTYDTREVAAHDQGLQVASTRVVAIAETYD